MLELLSKLKHNPEAIKKKVVVRDGKMYAKEELYIIFPERFVDVGLATLGGSVNLVNIYIIVDKDGNYSRTSLALMTNYTPVSIDRFNYLEKPQVKLTFGKDSIMTNNMNSVKDESALYDVLDEMLIKGNTPWYLGYNDLVSIFTEARRYNGSDLGDNLVPISVILSIIARDKNDTKKLFRYSLKNKEDSFKEADFISLSNVFDGYNNNMARLTGNYLQDGITSSLVNEDEMVTPIEKMIRD